MKIFRASLFKKPILIFTSLNLNENPIQMSNDYIYLKLNIKNLIRHRKVCLTNNNGDVEYLPRLRTSLVCEIE